MDTLEKAKLNASIRRSARFLNSGIPIYNSEILNTAGRKVRRRRRRTQAIVKRFAFHTNTKSISFFVLHFTQTQKEYIFFSFLVIFPSISLFKMRSIAITMVS